jgi:hypothetical protein
MLPAERRLDPAVGMRRKTRERPVKKNGPDVNIKYVSRAKLT